MNSKDYIAKRAAKELKEGDIVNLGIGIPTRVVDFLEDDITVHLHTENGVLGVGPTPEKESIDPDLVNAGKLPITVKTGASYFDSSASFAMIRGGHIDVSVLGVLQVDSKGRIANWAIPGKNILGVGGAMDLLEGSKRVIITMQHLTRNGEIKIVEELTYPETSQRKVNVIITEMAVFNVNEFGLVLTEIAEGFTEADIKKATSASYQVDLIKE